MNSRRFVGCVTLCVAGGTLLLTRPVTAQDKELTIRFTKETLFDIAADIHEEKTERIASRIVGLSPPLTGVKISRTLNDITLGLTAQVEDNLVVKFNLSLDRMAFYRMATAPQDVDGMLQMLQSAKEHEPLILQVKYRPGEHYRYVDLLLDLRSAILASEEAMREAAAQFVPGPAPEQEESPQGVQPESGKE